MRQFLPLIAALIAGSSFAQESRGPGFAPYGADRGELLRIFDTSGGFGIVQVAGAGGAVRKAFSLFPQYRGLESELTFTGPGPLDRLELLSVEAGQPTGIEAPADLRDAMAAMPSMPPGISQFPPAALFKAAVPFVPNTAISMEGPAGWLVLTRKTGRTVLPLKTAADVARWAAAAELQRRAYESIVLERFSDNLGKLGRPSLTPSAPTPP